VINEIPDTIKVWASGVSAWVITYIDLPSLNETLRPIVVTVKYGTAIVLLAYMTLKLVDQIIKTYDRVKGLKRKDKEED
jgi:hypothetical protein